MPPKTGDAKKPVSAPLAWKVVGGASSGGLVVREGVNLKSKELPEKLSTGSIIIEEELQGERVRYKRLVGSGPVTGWVSTKLKGKDLIVRHQLRVWVMCAGTRGDVQPYLALSVGLQKAGFSIAILSCEDYRMFVESYGLTFFDIAPSCEEWIRDMTGASKKQDKTMDSKSTVEQAMKGEPEKAGSDQKAVHIFHARYVSSAYWDCAFAGVSSKDSIPEDIAWADPARATQSALLLHGYYLYHQNWKEAGRFEKLAGKYSALVTAKAAVEEGAAAEKAAAQAAAAAEPAGEEAPAGQEAPAAEEAPAGEEAPAKPRAPQDEAEASWEDYRAGIRKGLRDILDSGGDGRMCGMFGLDALFLGSLVMDPARVKTLMDELEREKPDLVLYNFAYGNIAMHLEWAYGIPGMNVTLQPAGIFPSDPQASWITEETWPILLKMNPELLAYPTLQEAREKFKIEWQPDPYKHELQKVMQECLTGPVFGNTPASDMSLLEFHKRTTEGAMVGFLSSVGSKRFVSFLGEFTQRWSSKFKYTGFWIIDEDAQTSGPATMFGGPKLLGAVEDFIGRGSKPAYLGWGSCIGIRGAPWMCVLAVGALKVARMRGIVLAGWASLSYELLAEICGPEDAWGLCAYARENVLFIEKAPQTWLFPKCSVLVIHGGVGTLAAAWQSGVPLIVLPVWLDQFGNGFLNLLMGAGKMLPAIDETTPMELGYALMECSTSEVMIRGAQAVQLSMMRDNGIRSAIEHLNHFLTEDVPSGEWQAKWLRDDFWS